MVDSAGRKHLLIVDDEPVILQILKAVFEDEPVRLTCVSSGRDAQRVLEEQGCDLLITDKNLPDVNGLELLKLAKELNRFTEVIVITGYASLETALTAMEHDAFDYVVKPLNNVFDIRKKVRRALEKQALAMENHRLLGDLKDRNEALQLALDDATALQAELIQSEKLAGIGTLAAGIAHEVSSPLFGILGLAEAIPEEEDRVKVDSYAHEIAGYCNGIRDIVVDLSSYSRASSRSLEKVDIATMVASANRLVARTIEMAAVEVTVESSDGLLVDGRATEIQQVFVNLIKNAIEAVRDEHIGEGGRVQVIAGKGFDHCWVTIEDNGVGIPADVHSQLFDPFYTTKPPGKGTGLGLNVAYRIMTKHRGTISVRSGEEGGTVFRVQFPVEG
jgi:two-component system NtrC family sensor kinase